MRKRDRYVSKKKKNLIKPGRIWQRPAKGKTQASFCTWKFPPLMTNEDLVPAVCGCSLGSGITDAPLLLREWWISDGLSGNKQSQPYNGCKDTLRTSPRETGNKVLARVNTDPCVWTEKFWKGHWVQLFHFRNTSPLAADSPAWKATLDG